MCASTEKFKQEKFYYGNMYSTVIFSKNALCPRSMLDFYREEGISTQRKIREDCILHNKLSIGDSYSNICEVTETAIGYCQHGAISLI